ncbi:hypothetical protein CK203_070651 [Vitis vinifera]|uniref:Uncharacterized protein n=1 Tax=Vitis vinifera TaxID=29760 RepID=A0A438C181_VITVI|nr:hypothetical protein CK203_070651 [Vitis vinifera]
MSRISIWVHTWRAPLSGSLGEEHTALASTCHSPRSAACRAKGQSDGKSPPTIFDSRLQAAWILGTQGLNIGTVCGNSLIQSTAKMSTPSRSRSSARGDEDYFEWRETIERRQLESERQMQALLQETARLREENVVLRIQASSTGPPRGQRSRGQGANSRSDPESIYPGTAGAIPETGNVIPQSDTHPCTKLPRRKAQILLVSRQRDSVTRYPSCQT